MNLELASATRDLLSRERNELADLHALLNSLDASEDDLKDLKTALNDLEGVFLLVVCGEYNAGKSSLLNALLGAKVMLEGVTPTTDRVTIVSYGPEAKEIEASANLMRREFPADILKDVAFVDTPGTNAVIKEHQELTEKFVPRADLVLFITSADRPFTESERQFLELIGSWGKKIIILVNKLDILETKEEQDKVLEFVEQHAQKTLGVSPQVFGVRAKAAFKAKLEGNRAELAKTGLSEVEAFISGVLAENERVKLKLLNPLGVAQHLNNEYQDILKQRLELLEDDRKTLEDVDRQLSHYEKNMRRDYENYVSRIKTVLLEVERRGDAYFDDTIRLRNVIQLMNSERIKQDFEARVIRSADRDVDMAVSEMVDWFLQRNHNLWEDVMQFVNERRKAGENRIIGEVGGRFQYDREALIRSLREKANNVLESYDEDAEASRLADKLQSSVFQSGIGLVGGIGLGAAILAFVSSAAIDITGVTLGLTLAGIGFFIIPRRRQQAKKELHRNMQTLRDGLEESIGKEFDQELRKASEKLHTAIEPYTRFVRSELERLDALKGDLEASKTRLDALRKDVEALT
ncbi:MAG: dynamin family protein [Trueperaceae bacterium]|nr:dynamin family protein [Trueperaceae bacterium]